MTTVLYERIGAVAALTMNRPRYRNAQSRVLLEELDAGFTEAMADHDVRVVVLFGSGEHWSSGHDIGTPEELADRQARPVAVARVRGGRLGQRHIDGAKV